MDRPMREKYTMYLLKCENGKEVPEEGRILIDDLKEKGFEVIDSIEVERTE
jgi:hypothetical protein